ncbi:hypothetical protein Mapa_013297 [Marchantia paleacea]|nr:hypothetical protein Mapa_013297 [Marchantia paleacea]
MGLSVSGGGSGKSRARPSSHVRNPEAGRIDSTAGDGGATRSPHELVVLAVSDSADPITRWRAEKRGSGSATLPEGDNDANLL